MNKFRKCKQFFFGFFAKQQHNFCFKNAKNLFNLLMASFISCSAEVTSHASVSLLNALNSKEMNKFRTLRMY